MRVIRWATPLCVLSFLAACDPGSNEAAKAAPKASEVQATTATTAATDQGTSEVQAAAQQQPKAAATAEPSDAQLSAQLTRFARSTNALGLDLYAKAGAREAGKNVAISPASIALAFDMLYAGAGGETATQMAATLHLEGEAAQVHDDAAAILSQVNDPARTSYELRVVNRLFGDRSSAFEPAYVELTKAKYAAPIEALDFRAEPEAARVHINQWVSDQTNARIQDLLPPASISPDTRLVLTNAIYFLGKWQHPFDAGNTAPADFTLGGGEVVQVPTMASSGSYRHSALDGVDVVELPYAGEELAMLLVVPQAADGLSALEQRLDTALIDSWVQSLSPTQVELRLPRFELRSRSTLSKDLIALGMVDAFTNDADFLAISNPANVSERLQVSEAFHQVFVAVDEQGTEAAAATAIAMGRGGGAMQVTKVRADRPFMFVIREQSSGTLLFIGRVSDPR